jgi:hypothetical protein
LKTMTSQIRSEKEVADLADHTANDPNAELAAWAHQRRQSKPPSRIHLAQDGLLDLEFRGWLIGDGRHDFPPRQPRPETRRAIAQVYVTEEGRIGLSFRLGYVLREGGAEFYRNDATIVSEPAEALRWLSHGKKKTLGAASKTAWLKSARQCEPLRAFATIRVG